MFAQSRYLPFLLWLFPLSFFAYQFILRLWPGLMMSQIMNQFSIDASGFGLLAAFYYYGYAGMQIPVALLLDRFGVRYIVFIFATLCGLATLLFTYTTHFYLAMLARFLVGVGSAVGFLGVSKVISIYFPEKQYAKMIGFSFTLGLTGAIYGGKPVGLLIAHHSWKEVAVTLAILSIVIGVVCYLALRSPKDKQDSKLKEQFSRTHIKSVLTSPVLWCLALSNLLMVGALEGFADVWGVPYLVTAYELDKADAAGIVSLIFVGMLVGGPLLAFFSKFLRNCTLIALCGLGMAGAFAVLLMGHSYSILALSCLFFGIGVLCCYQVIVFAAGAELVSLKSLGVAVAFLNSINMLGGSFFHTVIGKVMDLFGAGALNGLGERIYAPEAYQHALSVIPACAFLGTLLVLGVGLRIQRTNR